MLNSTLALFTRSLRIDARSIQPHLARVVFAGVILLCVVGAHQSSAFFGAPGQRVFSSIAWLNLLFITLGGMAFLPSAISEEKEEGSLGLLKMAGISPAALLLGKSTTRVISLLLIVAIEFPFILLSITLGGVTMVQIVAVMVALAAYLLFIANLALACSLVGRTSLQSSSLMTLLLVAMLLIIPACSMFWSSVPFGARAHGGIVHGLFNLFFQWTDAISIYGRLNMALSTGFNSHPFSLQVIVHATASLLLFGFCWLTFEYFTREGSSRKSSKLVPARTSRRSGLNRAWPQALTWKDYYFFAGGKRTLVVRAILYLGIMFALLIWIASSASYGSKPTPMEATGATTMILMTLFAAIELAKFSASVFREEIKEQTLPLLMTLPITTSRLVWSKRLAIAPAIIPAVVVFGIGALFCPSGLGDALKEIFSHSWGWYMLIVFFGTVQLATYMSLVIKWGALPLAIFAVWLIHMLAGVFLSLVGTAPPGEAVVPCVIVLVAIGVLEKLIYDRLRVLAGR